jgi:hypothetical protein
MPMTPEEADKHRIRSLGKELRILQAAAPEGKRYASSRQTYAESIERDLLATARKRHGRRLSQAYRTKSREA